MLVSEAKLKHALNAPCHLSQYRWARYAAVIDASIEANAVFHDHHQPCQLMPRVLNHGIISQRLSVAFNVLLISLELFVPKMTCI